MKFILIHTDGYSIDCDDNYKTIDEVRREMNRQYNENIPMGGLTPEWEEMFGCAFTVQENLKTQGNLMKILLLQMKLDKYHNKHKFIMV